MNINDNYTSMVTRLRGRFSEDSSEEEFSRIYDEYHRFLLEHNPKEIDGSAFLYHADVRSNPVKRFVLKYITPGKDVLEVGMGDGTVSAALARNGNRVVGVDVSEFAVRRADERFGNIENLDLRRMDARNLALPAAAFDYVVGLDVIEHLPYEEANLHFGEVNRVLRPGGGYLIWTPLKCMAEKEEELHLKVYSLRELAAMLERAGFQVTFYDVRFMLFDRKVRVPRMFSGAVFFYERVLHASGLAGILKKSNYLRWLVMPPCMIEARKAI